MGYRVKISKEEEKAFRKVLRQEAKKRKYGFRGSTIFFVMGEYFISSLVFVNRNTGKIDWCVNVKKFSYDDILWHVINMQENLKSPVSLRAVGAFTSPSVYLEDHVFEFTDDYEGIAAQICDLVEVDSKRFIEKVDLDEYLINAKMIKSVYRDECNGVRFIAYLEVLKCIAHINKGEVEKSVELALKFLHDKAHAAFRNEGKNTFMWVLWNQVLLYSKWGKYAREANTADVKQQDILIENIRNDYPDLVSPLYDESGTSVANGVSKGFFKRLFGR